MNIESIVKEFITMSDSTVKLKDGAALVIITDGTTASGAKMGSPTEIIQLLVSMAEQDDTMAKIMITAGKVIEADMDEPIDIEVVRVSGPNKGKEYLN